MDIKNMCKQLRLAHLADVYEEIPFGDREQFVAELLGRELALRKETKAKTLIKRARFLHQKSLDSFEWRDQVHLPPKLDIDELESLNFIQRKENIVLSGSPGTGKTHLAVGLGHQACEQGKEVRFYRVADLAETLEKTWREGRFQQFRNRFKQVDLVILDEMGYVPFSREGAELLFQLITDWYEQKSVIITSNLEFSQWNRIFSDSRLTAALVDRVIHHAHILSFTGDSYRVTHALSRKN